MMPIPNTITNFYIFFPCFSLKLNLSGHILPTNTIPIVPRRFRRTAGILVLLNPLFGLPHVSVKSDKANWELFEELTKPNNVQHIWSYEDFERYVIDVAKISIPLRNVFTASDLMLTRLFIVISWSTGQTRQGIVCLPIYLNKNWCWMKIWSS